MIRINKKNKKSTIIASLLIAIIPLISPYAVFGISIVWIIGILYIMYNLVFSIRKNIKLNKKIISYFWFPIFSILISFNGLLVLNNDINLINQLMGLVIGTIILYCLWVNSEYEIVYKFSNVVGYFCGIFAIIQILMVLSGNTVPSGRIEGLDLVSGQSWVPETWGFRINSLFNEPSYFAIYLLPLFAANLTTMNYKNVIIFGFLILISSSTLGIISMFFVIGWQIFIHRSNLKSKMKNIIYIVIGLIILVFVIVNNEGLNSMFIRTIKKLSEIGSSDNSIRITGYLSYFSYYDLKEMLFGVGMSQFQNYFVERGIYLYNYSNSMVMMLLQYGIVGTIFSFIYYTYLAKEAMKRKSMVFFMLLIITMSVDYITFSYRYYNLLYFTLFFVASPCDMKYRSKAYKNSFLYNNFLYNNKKRGEYHESFVCNINGTRDKHFSNKK